MREENIRIIFGLKLRQLRKEKAWSLAELSKQAGLSASYLNEIEKGKKYPKAEKISALANAFKVPYDELVSIQLSKNLAPLGDLIMTGILNDLPLEVLGFNLNKLVDWISNAPLKVGAFFKTIIEISRNYNLEKEYFYFAILRSYQENNDNYFEDLENEAETFLKASNHTADDKIIKDFIKETLETEHNYKIDTFTTKSNDDLNSVRSFYIPKSKGKKPTLMLNKQATLWQNRFIIARELGFVTLKVKETERPHIPLLLKAPSFDIVLNNYRASYFGMAVLISKQQLINDLTKLFEQKTWNNDFVNSILKKYAVSPELLLLRMTNLMPEYFGLKKMFFLRFQSNAAGKYQLTRELHLSHLHSPHGNESRLHYCRRWLGTSLLKQLSDKQAENNNIETPLIQAQFSKYEETNITYFGIALARPMLPTQNTNVSVEIGWVVDEQSKSKINFLSDKSIETKNVNTTCEMCSIADCESRVKPPIELNKKQAHKNLRLKLKELSESN